MTTWVKDENLKVRVPFVSENDEVTLLDMMRNHKSIPSRLENYFVIALLGS
jgi:hypothetical protein